MTLTENVLTFVCVMKNPTDQILPYTFPKMLYCLMYAYSREIQLNVIMRKKLC